jgi:hypothetical protein
VVEVEGGVRHHRQDRRTQSRECPSMVSLAILSHVCFSLILITVPVERRGEIYPQEVIIHKFGVRVWEDEIQKRVRQGRHRWHVKIIKQINDRAWQTRGHKTQQLGADFVNMRQAIYSTEQSNKMKYHLEPQKRERESYVDDASAFWPDVPPLPPPPCGAAEELKAFCEEPGRESDCGGGGGAV